MNYNSLIILLGLGFGIFFTTTSFYIGFIISFIIVLVMFLFYKRVVFLYAFVFMLIGALITNNILSVDNQKIFKYIETNETKGYFTVCHIEKTTPSYSRLIVKINEINNEKVNNKIELSYYGDNPPSINHICYFEKMKINVFDKDSFLIKASDRIYFRGSVSQNNIKIVDISPSSPLSVLREFREDVNLKIKNTFSYITYPIIQALFTGETKDISEITNDVLRKTGISHILSVSGMHVVIIISVLGIFLDKNKYLKLLKYLVLIMFVIFAGASPSIIRATALYLLCVAAIRVNASSDSVHILCLLAIVSLLINPMLLYDKSFQLSYIATYGIITISKIFYFKSDYKFIDYFAKTASLTIGAQIATIPFIIGMNPDISLFSIPVNIIIIFILPLIYIFGILSIIFNFDLFVVITELITRLILFTAKVFSNDALPILDLNKSPVSTELIVLICILIYMYALNYENRYIRREIKESYK